MNSIQLYRDQYPDSPRDWDNIGTMIAFHGRYNLGDDHDFNHRDYSGWDEMEDAILKRYGKDAVILPLYLYDHGGITMNTTGFHCPWDSGQVGFIVAPVPIIRAAFGVKRVTAKVRKQAIDSLKAEVEVYDYYLRGEVYGYTLSDADGNTVESVSGFYGSDVSKNGMMDGLPEDMHAALKDAEVED